MSELDRLYREACETPSDVNEHLPTLREYARQCSHVTEFGVRNAVSTLALLAARPKRMVSYDVVVTLAARHVEDCARDAGIDFSLVRGDVLSLPAPIEPTDLLFVDTHHTYAQLKAELAGHAGRVRRFVLLHDVETFGYRGEDGSVPGLKAAVHEFLDTHGQWALAALHENNNGLAVLERV